MKRSTVTLALVLTLCLAAACTKQSLKTTYDKQATYIESFVSARMKTDTNATLVRTGGSYRLTLHDTLDRIGLRPDSLDWGGRVSLFYACYTLSSANVTAANLVATNVKSLADDAGWSLSDATRYKADTLILDDRLLPGLKNGLWGGQPGDEAFVLFTGELGYGNREKGTIPARSALVYQVWINSIENE